MSSKGKLRKFAELKTHPFVIQPKFDEVFNNNHHLKGKWNTSFFKNSNPITLELACGKGEYTVGLAELFPNRNFIGIDIKGARIWRGAKRVQEMELKNAGFIRTRIEFLNSFFDENEIAEIWITFPDPQLKKTRKRLTSARFLNCYNPILKNGGTINLKTDNDVLYDFTLETIKFNQLNLLKSTDDIYTSDLKDDKALNIRTFYEKGWLEQGLTSRYIQFNLLKDKMMKDISDEK